ncbi:phosphonoacetaldehyde hydrolase [Liquorilactobacillus satsumensis]|uniref:phosphonoacetaldehyde hydrolase n=1 Tax=Liquorilactobacillus satsumensis TaxID=259059 RepID=UPI001E53B70D|nr:phosphonoacetaldehyde hydrolase [Liquorilactobacillus satsumensis]MCC7667750.1 phosphonoacetaldehyde hydrolase [Liquorilactobacillus satsumensis]MCP9356919.1 phosphonoacetaldehyde hydrolase [Liquorilactobacillus satsumensis]MCP9370866.1 phosphonoacetaldehyde hydrolase [Liquorilactobacillus satsumensis]
MTIAAVVFDWAGTTVDYGSKAPIVAFSSAFKTYGISISEEQIRKDIGLSKLEHIKKIFQDSAAQNAWKKEFNQPFDLNFATETVYTKFNDLISAQLKATSYLKPGLYKLMVYFKEHNIKMATTSGYYKSMLNQIIPLAADQGYHPEINITAEDTAGIGRPAPAMLQMAITKLGLTSAAQVIKVGDTLNDILEGKNAHCISVGVVEGSNLMGLSVTEFLSLTNQERAKRKHDVRIQFEKAGADYVIDNLDDLIAIIEKLNHSNQD